MIIITIALLALIVWLMVDRANKSPPLITSINEDED
jgi:hypothetical protein